MIIKEGTECISVDEEVDKIILEICNGQELVLSKVTETFFDKSNLNTNVKGIPTYYYQSGKVITIFPPAKKDMELKLFKEIK